MDPDISISPRMKENARGVSDIIGIILLIALVVTVAAITIGLGSNAVQDTKGVSEIQQAENVFAELDARASTVALGEGPNQRTINLGLNQQQKSNMHIEQDSHIRIKSEALGEDVECNDGDYADPDEDNCHELLNKDIRSLTYTHGNSEIAYQTGGVWKMNDDGSTELITPPNVQYKDATLTMPMVNIANDEGQLATNSLTFTRGDSDIPDRTSKPVNAEKVTIVVTSEYYKAWGDYFENDVEGNVNTKYDHDANTVEIELGLSGDIRGSFDSAIVANGDVRTGSNGDIYGPVMSTGDIEGNVHGKQYAQSTFQLFRLDPHIEQMVDEAEDNYTDLGTVDSSMVLSEGDYYADEINLESGDNLVLDVTTGDNITIVVDGKVNLENSANLHVTNDVDNNTHARILTSEDVSLKQGSPSVTTDGGPEDFQVYGVSETDILVSQGSSFEGVIYAPSDRTSTQGGDIKKDGKKNGKNKNKGGGSKCKKTNYDVCIGSNADIEGAIVGGSTMVGQSATLTYDENLADFSPTISPSATLRPRLLHLHVSVNDVSVNR